MSRRVVITGAGVVSSLGNSAEAMHAAMIDGRSGIGNVELFETEGIGCRRAGEIKDFKAREYLGRRNLRALDRTGALLTTAAAFALEDAGWSTEDRESMELGLVVGTMYCSVATIAAFDRRAAEAGPVYASPFDFANSVINAAAGQAAIWHGLRGMNSTIACGAASGQRAIAYAAEAVASGRADVVLAGGAEELCRESFVAFDRSGRLSRQLGGSVPLHRERDGCVLGEGAGLLVLESEESASKRGARVLAVVSGAGAGFDPSLGRDSGSGMRAWNRAITQAMAVSARSPSDLVGIGLAADGSSEDLQEARAIVGALGSAAAELPVLAVASNFGQCLGAGGGLQAVAAMQSLQKGRLPGVRGLDGVDPAVPLEGASEGTSSINAGSLMLLGSSFDGHRAAVVISSPSSE